MFGLHFLYITYPHVRHLAPIALVECALFIYLFDLIGVIRRAQEYFTATMASSIMMKGKTRSEYCWKMPSRVYMYIGGGGAVGGGGQSMGLNSHW